MANSAANQRLRRAIVDENGGGPGVGAMRPMHKAAAYNSIFMADIPGPANGPKLFTAKDAAPRGRLRLAAPRNEAGSIDSLLIPAFA
jgi:hypothetical protein